MLSHADQLKCILTFRRGTKDTSSSSPVRAWLSETDSAMNVASSDSTYHCPETCAKLSLVTVIPRGDGGGEYYALCTASAPQVNRSHLRCTGCSWQTTFNALALPVLDMNPNVLHRYVMSVSGREDQAVRIKNMEDSCRYWELLTVVAQRALKTRQQSRLQTWWLTKALYGRSMVMRGNQRTKSTQEVQQCELPSHHADSPP